MNKQELYERGADRLRTFCEANRLSIPTLRRRAPDYWPYSACAYYRPTYIAICVPKCAALGYASRAWSWPGYVIDRTPYGVLQHELGHHVDIVTSGMTSGYQGTYSCALRAETREDPITSYAPNDAEWFAEIFRLFVTNAALLQQLRPKTYRALRERFKSVSGPNWRQAFLGEVPERTLSAAQHKINLAAKRAGSFT